MRASRSNSARAPALNSPHWRLEPRMADPNDKVAGQIPGRYYVDSQCIDCDLCRETAPANFMRNDEAGYSFVFKQPESAEEETLCKDALDNCPVEAIGSDG